MSNYPISGGGGSWNYINPGLHTPYVQDWNVRFQREIARGTVLDIRYVGNKATHVWHYQNVNELNTVENGFIKEFQNAQSNLAIANGITVAQLTALPTVAPKVANFSNAGLPGQVALPIFQAAFGANGANGALSASSGFGSSGFISNLQQGAIGSLAGTLASTNSATYFCRLVGSNFGPCAAAGFTANNGYAQNIFRANPFANSVNYQNDDANSNYNGFQIEMRRAFSHGLMLDANYTLSHTLGTVNNVSSQTATTTFATLRNGHLSYGPTPFDHRHALILYGTYELPFGKGKAVNVNNAVLNKIVGNWTIGSTNTIQSGGPSNYTGGRLTFNNTADGGVAFGNGMNIQQVLQRTATMTTGQYQASCTCFKTNVADIVQANGSPNPAYIAQAQNVGAIGNPIWYYGKTGFTFNLSMTKEFRINERTRLGLWGEANNFLNHPFFGQGSMGVTSTTFGNITTASGNRTILLRAYLDF